ncbi:MAG: PAS domain-containing protein [Pseudomonadales bacterium]|nr:PAS domain-containing protein [Pseudomonadales bacterium]
MKDEDRTKEQLIAELSALRRSVAKGPSDLMFDILNELPVGIAIMKGDDFEYIEENKFIAELNGLTPEEHIGKKVKDIVHPSMVEDVVENLKKVKSC